MSEIPFVKKEHAALARKMEEKLLALSPEAGLLFVGVSVGKTEQPDESPSYSIWIGCRRGVREGLMAPLVQVTLRDEITEGADIRVESHRGKVRP